MTNQQIQTTRPQPVPLTRVLQVLAIGPGLAGVVGALLMVRATVECRGELCGLGFLAAGALGIPAAVVLLAGVVSVLTQRRYPAASFGWALAGTLVAALVATGGFWMFV